MRIIGGLLGGRQFNPKMNKWPTRPTTDHAKEALFNILMNRIDFEDCKFLDLFGGTGSLCFEMASRGCVNITYVDKYKACVVFVKQQLREFELLDIRFDIYQKDVGRFINQTQEQYSLIFADPPYRWDKMKFLPEAILKRDLLSQDGLLIIEHDGAVNFKHISQFQEMRKYGQTIFSFFKNT